MNLVQTILDKFNLFVVSYNLDGRHELCFAQADHDQRPPVGGEEEGFGLVGKPQLDNLQHYRVAHQNLTPSRIS